MAYAPHSNDAVLHQLRCGITPTTDPLVFGSFYEKDTGNGFEYAERRHPDDSFAPEMPHIIYLNHGATRLAKVLKTVAFVVVDEDENGPVIEKWQIKQHRHYDTSWVRA